ncbi:sodium/glutamate symporter [Eubacteriales bacterium]|nr:sodium:glutamate symporter [Faecalicatena sp. BF-R-105]GKH51324.1 sodium/glutamate symporter [Eubacteriales bacterium]GKH64043.1 sodium/glutamate symporter [Eubacteriales bacterium]
MSVSLNLYQSVAVAAVLYWIGSAIRGKIGFFQKFCIPAPVIGGLIFALLALGLRVSGILQIEFDTTLQDVFMTTFFTSIGFSASFRLLKKGCVQVFVFLGICTLLVVMQNLLGVGLAAAFGLEPLLGLAVGSIPMVGGHGTSAAFGPELVNMGISGAATVAVAAATFGLIAGSAIGGPIANWLIQRKCLEVPGPEAELEEVAEEESRLHGIDTGRFTHSLVLLFIAMGLGTVVTAFFKSKGITVPSYIGGMLIACVIRNAADAFSTELPHKEIEVSGNVSLALPMVVMLFAQVALMAFFAVFVTYQLMGRDYEAAVMAAANCGFGMGATPNAMANMDAVTSKFGIAPRAYFIVPLVGGLFIDFTNSLVITTFVNFLS